MKGATDRDARIRPLSADDGDVVEGFYRRLSPESSYTRFFSASPDAYRRVAHDASRRVVLLAEEGGEVVAIAECCIDPRDATRAEAAFAVLDRAQHHGLGSLLLRELRCVAMKRGVRRFTAEVLATNQAMLHVFWSSGLAVQASLRDGVYDVEVALDQGGPPSGTRQEQVQP